MLRMIDLLLMKESSSVGEFLALLVVKVRKHWSFDFIMSLRGLMKVS